MDVRRSPELEQLDGEAIAAVGRGDDAWFREHTATGEIVMGGSGPGELVRGFEQVFGSSIASVQAIHHSAGMRHEPGKPEAYEAGDAGFILSEGRFVFEDGSHIPTRSIVVLARDGGDWKMIGSFLAVTPTDDLVAAGSPIATRA
jgi:hypothetical protein